MRNSLSRRIALRRPKPEEIERLEQEIADLEANGTDDDRLLELRGELDRQMRRSKLIPYLDPVDVRYNRFERVPRPVAQAVMFCLMDVSGSMTEHMKDLAKRFFILLFLFLKRRYRHVDIVFIRHTHEAKEVDEETFFYSAETGGTVVSTALEEMRRIIADRYPDGDWNIYAAQASDGDNISDDNAKIGGVAGKAFCRCASTSLISKSARNEGELGGSAWLHARPRDRLWRTYKPVARPGAPIAMRKVRDRQGDLPGVPRTVPRKRHGR